MEIKEIQLLLVQAAEMIMRPDPPLEKEAASFCLKLLETGKKLSEEKQYDGRS